jgi:hypothetical protein
MFAGVKIKIGADEFIVPPISLGQLRNGTLTKLKEHDLLVAEEKTFEAVILRGEIILEALQRNYPDFAPDELWNYLDLENCGPLWLAVLGASGFTPGEDRAVRAEVTGTSSPSTEASPPLTGGLITK